MENYGTGLEPGSTMLPASFSLTTRKITFSYDLQPPQLFY